MYVEGLTSASWHRRRTAGERYPQPDACPATALCRGSNVVERCFNELKQWRGIAMRSDKTARDYHAGLCLAATLHWLTTGVL